MTEKTAVGSEHRATCQLQDVYKRTWRKSAGGIIQLNISNLCKPGIDCEVTQPFIATGPYPGSGFGYNKLCRIVVSTYTIRKLPSLCCPFENGQAGVSTLQQRIRPSGSASQCPTAGNRR